MRKYFLMFLLMGGCVNLNSHVISKDESLSNTDVQLGLAYIQQGQLSLAKQRLQEALKLQPRAVLALDGMAYYNETVGEVRQAKNLYQRAIRYHQDSGVARNNYGTFLCRQGFYEESIQQFLLAVEDKTYLTAGKAYQNAGACALKIPDKKLAEVYFEKARVYGG